MSRVPKTSPFITDIFSLFDKYNICAYFYIHDLRICRIALLYVGLIKCNLMLIYDLLLQINGDLLIERYSKLGQDGSTREPFIERSSSPNREWVSLISKYVIYVFK